MPSADQTRVLPRYAAGSLPFSRPVHGMDEVLAEDTFWPDHSHPTHELVWNHRGASEVMVGDRKWTVTPRMGLWMPAGVLHSAFTPAGTWYRAIQFGVGATRTLSARPVSVEMTGLLRLLLDRLDEEDLSPDSRSLTEAMVEDVLQPAANQFEVTLPVSRLLEPIVTALLRNPADPTTLEGWAQRLQVSTRTVARAFRHDTGLSFVGWVTTVRAQRAIVLLGNGAELAEAAAAIGYRSVSAFGVAFRRATGLTPGQVRPWVSDPH